MVPIISPTKQQSRVVHSYLRAIFKTPLLAAEVVNETSTSFELRSGTRIEVMAGDWRTIRAFTLLAAIVDEACFFGLDAESYVKSDTELIRALKPGLATVGGKLVAISTPYAEKGWAHQTWKRHFGNDKGTALVWNCPSRTMNPTLSQRVVDEALAEDLAAARSEYMGEWRQDISAFLPREVIERLVIEGRTELLPQRGTWYFAFADLSGGRTDDAALAVAHNEGRVVVVDCARRWKPPFNPHQIIQAELVPMLKRYGIHRVTGDNYSAEFVSSSFESAGIHYERCDKTASELFLEFIPRACSDSIELPDDETLVSQLANLQRRTRSGGRDQISHAPGGHDDLANVVAGVGYVASIPHVPIGAMPRRNRVQELSL